MWSRDIGVMGYECGQTVMALPPPTKLTSVDLAQITPFGLLRGVAWAPPPLRTYTIQI
jgi:hypothetical protein